MLIQNMADLGVPKGSRAETKERGSPPIFTDIHLVRGNKSDIFVEGASAFVKHDTRFNISIISSQLGETTGAGLPFSFEPPLNGSDVQTRLRPISLFFCSRSAARPS